MAIRKTVIKRYESQAWVDNYPVTAWAYIENIPSTFPPSAHTHNYAGSSSAGGDANNAVKLNGQAASYYLNYNNFTNTPTIPTKTSQLTNDSGYLTSSTLTGDVVIDALGYTPGTYSKPSGGIPASDLAQTYYLASNPNGYTSNIGTVTTVKLGTTSYSPTSGVISLPAYPTTLPASDVYSWAKAATKPSYTLDEVSDGSTRKLANYLPLVGGNMTGNIAYAGSKATSTMIRFINNTADANGNGIAIGGGGIVIIGAGESNGLSYGSAGDENLYLAADTNVYLYSNAQNGIDSAKIASFNTSGVFNAPTLSENGTSLANKYQAKGNYAAADHTHSQYYLASNPNGYTSNTGTVTSVAVKMNGTVKGTITTSGTIDLGTVLTSHQDISGKADKASMTAGWYRRVYVNAQGIVTEGDQGDTDTNTWRKVQLNGVDKLGNATSTNPLNIKNGSGISITESSGAFTFALNLTGDLVTDALGYTPYNSSNPNGYTSNIGTVTTVKLGSTSYSPSSGVISLPAYPTTLPASDVYSWAKASTKPSYNFSEIGAGNITMGDGANYVLYRTHASWRSGYYYHTTGNEAVVFANTNASTSWIFVNAVDPTDRKDWTNLGKVPAMQIKTNSVAINKLIANGATPSYNLDVNGTANATTLYENGTSLASKYLGISATAADSSKLNGQVASYYLNYNNLSNKPTIYTDCVRYVSQSLTDAQKSQARTNIGAGTSNFTGYTSSNKLSTSYISGLATVATSGSYNDLSNKPTIPNVPSWALQSTKPSYDASEITCDDFGDTLDGVLSAFNTAIDGKAASYHTHDTRYVRFDTASQGLNATQKSNARTNIGAGTGNGTVTSVSVKINGTVKGTVTTSGTIDLGTIGGGGVEVGFVGYLYFNDDRNTPVWFEISAAGYGLSEGLYIVAPEDSYSGFQSNNARYWQGAVSRLSPTDGSFKLWKTKSNSFGYVQFTYSSPTTVTITDSDCAADYGKFVIYKVMNVNEP